MAMGGGSGLIIILIIILTQCLGGGQFGDLGGLAGELAPPEQAEQESGPVPTINPAEDPDAALQEKMNAVYTDLDALWTEIFAEAGQPDAYSPPPFVLFEGSTQSACGGATEAVGPHYCPLDQTIFVDFSFFTALREQFGARGDFAPDYVIAHEFGHHIQNLLGIADQVRQLQQQNPDRANDLSIAMELQADCFAGVWASTLYVGEDSPQGEIIELDQGEVNEAIEAAAAVGDDRIQEQATGMVNPEQWTHGSSEQRMQWFTQGYEAGDPSSCDTFSALG